MHTPEHACHTYALHMYVQHTQVLLLPGFSLASRLNCYFQPVVQYKVMLCFCVLSRVVPATVACMHAAWFLHTHMCCVHACDPAAAAPACGSCLYIHHALFGAPSLSWTYYFTSHHSCLVVQWVLPLVTISELVMMRYIEPFARDWHAY